MLRSFPAENGNTPRRIFLMSDPDTDYANLPTQTVAKTVVDITAASGAVKMFAGMGSEADATDSAHPCILDSSDTWNKWGWA